MVVYKRIKMIVAALCVVGWGGVGWGWGMYTTDLVWQQLLQTYSIDGGFVHPVIWLS